MLEADVRHTHLSVNSEVSDVVKPVTQKEEKIIG